MSQRDVFALGKSDLNAFLFASVGTEINGSSLTVLSTLARLGDDPWQRAAGWARMSRAAAGSALAAAIGGMPLREDDLAAAPATAARLMDVLFTPAAAPASPVRTPRIADLRAKGGKGITTYLAIGLVVVLVIVVAFEGRNVATTAAAPAQATAHVTP